jgi:starch-binding outer membrane protein, SusD/RagB family
MKVISNIMAGIVMLSIITGCSHDLLDEKPPHLITTESLYSSLAGFETGLNGLYASLREERQTTTDIEMRAGMFFGGTDNMTSNYKSSRGFNFITQQWGDANNPSEPFYADVFVWLYSIINASNTIINQAEEREDIDWSGGESSPSENKERVIAEAKAIRAWAYRHLTYGWGDVPLSLNESLGSNIRTDWAREPVANVQRQVISDLLFAEKQIPVEPTMRGRITKGAIQHYLAEMYLVLNKPDSALFWADKVIGTPQYKLITDRYGVRKDQPGVAFMDMFYEGNENRDQGNTEALWVWQFAIETIGGSSHVIRRYHTGRFSDWVISGVRAIVDTYERGGRGRSRQALTKWAVDYYEPSDERGSNHALRKYFILNDATANAPYPADKLPPGYSYGDTIWLKWNVDITPAKSQIPDWPFIRKVEGSDPNNVGGGDQYNDVIYLRLAETYLIKAEAQLLLNRPEDAASTINIIRRRSNASDVNAADINIDFILDERSRELVLEEHRRWTLLRTGKWMERVKKYNQNGGHLVSERDLLFPIPQIVIDANLTNEMPQNPGW